MAITIRPAGHDDLPAIVDIYNHYVENSAATFDVRPVTVEERRPWFAAHGAAGPHRLFVAADPRDEVRGWASTSPFRPRPAYATTVEASVYCRPGSTGLGLGTRLYATLFGSIAGEDLERCVAGVTLPNPASVALHRRFGFRSVGRFTRVGRKFGSYWDVAWFERPVRAPFGRGDDRPSPEDPRSGSEGPG